MNGVDILMIVAFFLLLWQLAIEMDDRERRATRLELRRETWRKIHEIGAP